MEGEGGGGILVLRDGGRKGMGEVCGGRGSLVEEGGA